MGTMMRTMRTMVAVAILALGACGESTSGDADGGRADAPAIDAPSVTDAGSGADCGPIGLPTCVQGDCCRDPRPGEFVPGTCTPTCPAGTVDQALCDPAPGCGGGFDFCEENADCTLALNECCHPCGMGELENFDAIHTSQTDAHRASVCPEEMPCPLCATMPNPNIGATCDDTMRCVGFDVRTLPLAQCEVDTDCKLRVQQCCECGGDTSPEALIAIRVDGEIDYQGLVCSGDFGCPECAPSYPDTHQAYCRAGVCVVDFAPDSGG